MVRGKRLLVQTDRPNKQPLHTNNPARFKERSSAADNPSNVAFCAPGRTSRMTSNPGLIRESRARNASRKRRRIRLRVTDSLETVWPTTTANRDSANPFALNFTPHTPSNTPLPFAKSALMSVSFRRRFAEDNIRIRQTPRSREAGLGFT